jgi:hypothetical protein
MKQGCHLSMIWLTWIGIPAIAIVGGVLRGWIAGVALALFGIVALIAYP